MLFDGASALDALFVLGENLVGTGFTVVTSVAVTGRNSGAWFCG